MKLEYNYQVTYSANNNNTFKPEPALHKSLADAESSARDWLDGYHYLHPGSESVCRIYNLRGVMLEIMAKHGRHKRVYWTRALPLLEKPDSKLVLVTDYELVVLYANDDYYGRYGNKRSHTDRATMFVRVCQRYEDGDTRMIALDVHFKYLPGSGWWIDGYEWLGKKDAFRDFMASCGVIDYDVTDRDCQNFPYKVAKQLDSILNKLWKGSDSLTVQVPTQRYLELTQDA